MKICVIHATAGAGHRKAAEAIYDGIRDSTPHEAVIVDSLDYTSRFYKAAYSGVYTFMISKIPWAWGIIFALVDIPWLQPLVRPVRRMQNALQGRPLHKFLMQEDFDYIFSTHFFPNEVAASLKRQGKIRSVIVSVVTDYDVHRIWLARGIDYYAVATDWTKAKLKQLGVAAEKIQVTGIPVHTKFSSHTDIPGLKQRLDLDAGAFTVLIATGSFGIGPIEEVVDSIDGLQLLVVCGHNEALYKRLSAKKKDLVKVYGLVNNMDELMAVADIMVTKPGGLSICEALVSRLPLIFFSAIPGQETNNVKVLSYSGVGRQLKVGQMNAFLKELGTNTAKRHALQEKVAAIARPQSVKEILALIA